jgi:predicted DNA-binding antitoxin AbrB/MazE fold protein
VDAIYENGKLVLQQPLPLPERTHVRVTIESDTERAAWLKLSEQSLTKVWGNANVFTNRAQLAAR